MGKYVIWGTGFRGRTVYQLMKGKNIVAFLESDILKIGKTYFEIPIIDIEEYKLKYDDCLVIVSPTDYYEIEKKLIQENIYHYLLLNHNPSELQGYGIDNLVDRIVERLKNEKKVALYGFTLFSFLVYAELLESGKKDVILVPSKNDRKEFVIYVKEHGGKVLDYETVVENDYKILVTDEYDIEMRGNHIQAYDFSQQIDDYYNFEIEKMKKKYEGKRCFIVATGPSLQLDDLNKLYEEKEICFSMNLIFRLRETKWRPNFYLFIDRRGIDMYSDEIGKYDAEYKFISDAAHDFWEKYKTPNLLKIHCCVTPYAPLMPSFSNDLSRVVYAGGTVTYACIQMAIYMGFKDIYLLGVDFNYSFENGKALHFYNDEERENSIKYYYRDQDHFNAYTVAKEYALKNDVNIYNATRGGKLEIFERVNFDDLF